MKALRADLVFSYWIFIWFVLYEFKLINYSPKFPIILGIIENIIMFILMLLFGTSVRTIIYFILINICIKAVPFYYLRNETIKLKDVYFTVVLFLLFIIWLHINEQSIVSNLKIIYDSLLYGKDQTPFMSLLRKVMKNYKTSI
jgi:hypothetical protein